MLKCIILLVFVFGRAARVSVHAHTHALTQNGNAQVLGEGTEVARNGEEFFRTQHGADESEQCSEERASGDVSQVLAHQRDAQLYTKEG